MNRPLRVLFLHASRDNANEYTVHRRLALHVDPDLVKCFFVWQSSLDTSQHEDLKPPGSEVSFFDFGRKQNLPTYPSKPRRALMVLRQFPGSIRNVSQQIRQIRPDVIYTTQQRHEVVLAKCFSSVYRLPHIIHDCYPIGPWLGNVTFRLLLNAEHVFASCDYVRRTGIEVGIPKSSIETMHHMCDTDVLNVEPDRSGLRDEFGWPADTPVVTGAARLDLGKGFLELLDAIALVQQQAPNARLLICGEPSPGTDHHLQIYQRVRELGLEGVVAFAGYRTDLARIMASSDLFCQPIRNDASSLVILDAMVAGNPVVSCSSGSVPEVVIDGETGFLTAPGDYQGLAANMIRLIQDKDLARQLGEAGRLRALTVFGPAAITQEWASKLYRRVGAAERSGLARPEETHPIGHNLRKLDEPNQ